MNEVLFFTHIFLLLSFLLISLRLGKKALFVFIAMQGVFANLFVTKQIVIFNFSATCSDMYVVAMILALNLLHEYFGKLEAKKAINIAFIFAVLFAIVSKFHLFYEPSVLDKTHVAFNIIFAATLRIVTASIVVFFIVAKFDIWLYPFFRRIFGKNSLIVSMIFATIIVQIIDTFAFGFLGLYGVLDNLLEVILISFMVKTITIFSSILFIYFSKKFLKKPILEHEH